MALEHISPNTRLMRELRQVAQEVDRTVETLRGVNQMPSNFPVEALSEICLSLAHLQDGTAEGCQEPLNYARHMLPLIRRDHFYFEDEQPDLDDDAPASFTRDNPLDQSMTRLYGAVGTALDEYRAQAKGQYDDTVGDEESIELGDDAAFADVSDRSGRVIKETASAQDTLAEVATPNSERADNLRRQLQDGANLGHSVQSQIRVRPIVARWYRSASAALRVLPDVMAKTAEGMRVGADVAQIWHKEWSAFQGRLRDGAYTQIAVLRMLCKQRVNG